MDWNTIETLMDENETDSPFEVFGLRSIHKSYKVGSILPHSKVWKFSKDGDDCRPTRKSSNSASALNVSEQAMQDILSYPGDYVVLIHGRQADRKEWNTDINEVCISNPRVIAIWKKEK